MRFAKLFFLFLTVALLAGTTGCASLRNMKKKSAAAAVKDVPEKVGEDLVKAFKNKDAALFLKQLSPEVRKNFGEKDFEATCKSMEKELGKPVSYAYLVNLQHPVALISVWKIAFERKSTDGTKTIRQEVLFRVVAAKVDGKIYMLSFRFI